MSNQLTIFEKADPKPSTSFKYENTLVDVLMSNLGTFWSQTISDDLLRLRVSGQSILDDQTILDTAAAIASVSMFELPVFNKKVWQTISFSEAELISSKQVPYKLGDDDIQLGGETPITLGQTRQVDSYRIKLPDKIKTIGYVVDNIFKPELVWTEGVNFKLDSGYIVFSENPFDKVKNINVIDNNKICTLWLCNLRQDLHDVYNEFGYVLDLYAKASTDNYLTLVQAAFNSLINGSNALALRTYIAAVLGIKTIQNETETVELIQKTAEHLQIVTNKDVYLFAKTATSLVAVGDTVYRGDIVVDTVRIYDSIKLRTGDLPFSFLLISPHLMQKKLTGALIFKNKSVSTVYTLDADGYADVRFEVGGDSRDVSTFWENAKNMWEMTSLSIADSLRKTPGTNMPVESDILETINPMNYLIKNIFNYNCIIVSIKIESSWINAKNYLLPLLPYIRNIIPPSTALFLITEMNQGTENCSDMSDDNGTPAYVPDIVAVDTATQITETCEVFTI